MGTPAVTRTRQSRASATRREAPARLVSARWVRIALLVTGGILLLVFFLAVLERILYAGDVMPGVHVDGVDVSGASESDAYADLSTLAADLENAPIEAKIAEQTVSALPSAVALDLDELATLQAVRAAARSGNPVDQTFGALLRRFRDDEVELRFNYNRDALDALINTWQSETLDGRVEGDLQFDGTTVVEVQPQAGTGVLHDDAMRLLDAELRSPTRDAVTLPVGQVEPEVDAAEVARAAAEARELLDGEHVLLTDGATLTITPVQLASALDAKAEANKLELTIDGAKLREALGDSLSTLETPPVDAGFEVTTANTVSVVPSGSGRQVDMDAVGKEILDGNRRITALLTDVEPEHDTAWAESLGIKEQVSTFTTNYPSGQARVTNIHRGADIINNMVVEPGETFSLDAALGPRTGERGFVVAPVFYGEFTEDFGGGVSQLATTFFNAVFFGGYEDVYHKPHTIYISRYPMGREATLNYGTVDVSFRNNSKAGVLIRTAYSPSSITVTFYGDKEGKTVTEVDRKVLEERPVEVRYYDCPGPEGADKENVCATLPLGETEEVEHGYAGYDVEYFRLIERPGAEPERERFFWRYRMTPTVVLVGTAAPTTTTSAATPGSTPPSVTPTTVTPATAAP
jgi:vancomycin resistance protein YoaR